MWQFFLDYFQIGFPHIRTDVLYFSGSFLSQHSEEAKKSPDRSRFPHMQKAFVSLVQLVHHREILVALSYRRLQLQAAGLLPQLRR